MARGKQLAKSKSETASTTLPVARAGSAWRRRHAGLMMCSATLVVVVAVVVPVPVQMQVLGVVLLGLAAVGQSMAGRADNFTSRLHCGLGGQRQWAVGSGQGWAGRVGTW
jgi:hypothetical protein